MPLAVMELLSGAVLCLVCVLYAWVVCVLITYLLFMGINVYLLVILPCHLCSSSDRVLAQLMT